MEDFFAPPPFDVEAARTRLERSARELQLPWREGCAHWRGRPVVAAAVEGAELVVRLAQRPAERPQWEMRRVRNAADLRRCLDDLKARLTRWEDGD